MLRTIKPITKLLSQQEQQVFMGNSWTVVLPMLVSGTWEALYFPTLLSAHALLSRHLQFLLLLKNVNPISSTWYFFPCLVWFEISPWEADFVEILTSLKALSIPLVSWVPLTLCFLYIDCEDITAFIFWHCNFLFTFVFPTKLCLDSGGCVCSSLYPEC